MNNDEHIKPKINVRAISFIFGVCRRENRVDDARMAADGLLKI